MRFQWTKDMYYIIFYLISCWMPQSFAILLFILRVILSPYERNLDPNLQVSHDKSLETN
jgi:hypothetical protein